MPDGLEDIAERCDASVDFKPLSEQTFARIALRELERAGVTGEEAAGAAERIASGAGSPRAVIRRVRAFLSHAGA